jgi:hypothetical protein
MPRAEIMFECGAGDHLLTGGGVARLTAITLSLTPTLCATTMDDRKLLALAKKNAAAALKKPAVTPKYDSTLQPDPEDVERLKKFMNEMKKRDF